MERWFEAGCSFWGIVVRGLDEDGQVYEALDPRDIQRYEAARLVAGWLHGLTIAEFEQAEAGTSASTVGPLRFECERLTAERAVEETTRFIVDGSHPVSIDDWVVWWTHRRVLGSPPRIVLLVFDPEGVGWRLTIELAAFTDLVAGVRPPG